MGGVNIPSYTKEVAGVKWTASWDDKGNISYKGVDKDGKEVSSTAPRDIIKAAALLKDMAGNNSRRSLKEELKASFKQIAKGTTEAVEMMKEPFRMAEDLYKAGKLIGQGKFRELRDRAALRIHDNVEAMGLLSDNMQKRINDANKRIEERLGIEDREKNPNITAKVLGRSLNAPKDMLKRLSGRTGVQSVKSVKGKDTGKGLSR